MSIFKKVILWISDLRAAIILLLLIALASGIGTIIPQGESKSTYISIYESKPLIGFINGNAILSLQLDHIYSSSWFLFLLAWLGLALIICSLRRQLPTLKASLRWIDYKEPRQLSKLSLAETFIAPNTQECLEKLADHLQNNGWKVKKSTGRLAARKGVMGRAGPPIVHIGLVVLMLGSTWGALGGQKFERFLTPGRSINLFNSEGVKQITLNLANFGIERDPTGRPEQFRSKIEIIEPINRIKNVKEISVNHPLRYKGMTIYQADWSLAAITLQIEKSPSIRLPLSQLTELGDQIWGLVLPTKPDGSDPVLLSIKNESGPVRVFNSNGEIIGNIRPGGPSETIKEVSLKVINVIPASGILIKHDPGVPLVYTGFAITLVGSALSILATRQIWALLDPNESSIHIGGLCNRNLSGLAKEIPILIERISEETANKVVDSHG